MYEVSIGKIEQLLLEETRFLEKMNVVREEVLQYGYYKSFKGGDLERMALEEIKKVTETEQAAQSRKAEAAAEAKRLVAQARRDGETALAQARQEAEAQAAAMMAQAEEEAAAHTAQVLEDKRAQCREMEAAAEKRLDEAADLIVRRVVQS